MIENGKRGAELSILVLPFRSDKPRVRMVLLCLPRPLKANESVEIEKTERSFDSLLDYTNKGACNESLTLAPRRTASVLEIVHYFPTAQEPHKFTNVSPSCNKAKHKELVGKYGKKAQFLQGEHQLVESSRPGFVKCITTANCDKKDVVKVLAVVYEAAND